MEKVTIPESVMERIHQTLVESILSTPDYIDKIINEVLNQAASGSGRSYYDTDKRPFFERILRRELETMLETSMKEFFKEKYAPVVDQAVRDRLASEEQLPGSLAHAFAKMLAENHRLRVDATFNLERTD